LNLTLRLAAAADIEEAYRWYEERRVGLGQEYLQSVEATLALVMENPRAFPVVHRDTRRALLRRFPYVVFYRLLGEEIIVVACFHAKRDPTQWRART